MSGAQAHFEWNTPKRDSCTRVIWSDTSPVTMASVSWTIQSDARPKHPKKCGRNCGRVCVSEAGCIYQSWTCNIEKRLKVYTKCTH